MSTDELLDIAIKALRAQQVLSDMQQECGRPKPDDPRYTEFIGEWNGYHAPEQRYAEFIYARRSLRAQALSEHAALCAAPER